MRFAWVTLLVILLDISSKFLLTINAVSESIRSLFGRTAFELSTPTEFAFENFIRGDYNTGNWLLLAGILAIFFTLFRIGAGFLNASVKTGLGLQLAAGGVFSEVIDLFIHGQIVHIITLRTEIFFPIAIGVSELAIASGLALLSFDLIQRQFTPLSSVIPLKRGRDQRIDLSALPRGIDNVHIDVVLSPAFCEAALVAINELVPQHLKRANDGKKIQLGPKTVDSLVKSYANMLQASMLRIKKERKPEKLDLLYSAILKYLQQAINNVVSKEVLRLGDLKPKVLPSYARSAPGADRKPYHEPKTVYFKVNKALLDLFSKVEADSLSKLRRSLFGSSNYLLTEALQTPLVQASSALDENVMLKHYVLLAHQDSAPNCYSRIDSLLGQVFASSLDALPKDEEEGAQEETNNPLSSISLSSEYQRALNQASVLMHPSNITALLDTDWTVEKLENAGQKKGHSDKLRQHLRFQRYQQALLQNAFTNQGLIRPIVAAYEVAVVMHASTYDFNPTILHKVLLQERGFKSVKKRIEQIHRTTPSLPPLEATVTAYQNVEDQCSGDLNPLLLRFVRDFANYRRDLQLDFYVQQALNQVHLLENENDILTSRSNNTLHEFMAADEVVDREPDIINHAILKADLRGSTQITEELTRRNLNPATHFSRHFFSPINQIIEKYDAEKVFIEGDAIILIFNEYDATHAEHFCVSRACGMATDMLRVVDKQNKLLSGYGLPPLELGLGIAYNNTPPRFLFDNDTRITISPAINRADRLSSCHWAIKNWMNVTALSTVHIAVFEPSANALEHGAKAQKDMNYNLNGILLEPAAFNKLKTELKMRSIENPVLEFRGNRLYASRFPDTQGNYHPIIVREAPVQRYNPDEMYLEAEDVDGRFYYEVVYDKQVIEQLTAASRNKRMKKSGL